VSNLGFAYNANDSDFTYGLTSPCLGFDLLKGIVDDTGGRCGMSAFSMYTNGTDPRATLESYNYMRGFDFNGREIIDPTTGEVTKYMLAGDPTAGTGWLDSDPADKRFMMTSGPFTMEPGDSQEIALAIVVGRGDDRIESVEIMKRYDVLAQCYYRFGTGHPVFPHFQAAAGDGEARLTWTNPDDPALLETVVRYSLESYPEDPAMGLPVPNGNQGRFPGRPGMTETFVHADLEAGATYYYTAFAVGLSGVSRAMSLGQVTPSAPGGSAGLTDADPIPDLTLSVSPNPSRGNVRFICSVPPGAETHLTIFNTAGQAVRALDVPAAVGNKMITIWDGHNDEGRPLPAGIYFARLETGGRIETDKVIMMR
jgi:hypothetical protein